MAVNGVNGAAKTEQTQPKGEQRVVEQQEEEMFPVKEDKSFGETVLEGAFGTSIAFNLLPEDTQKNILENIKETSSKIKNAAKSGIHTAAENAREFQKEHPIIGNLLFAGPLWGVRGLDNLVNGD